MKKKQIAKKMLAVLLAAGMMLGTAACGSDGNNSEDAERKDASSIKEENRAAADETDKGQAAADGTDKDKTGETDADDTNTEETSAKKTEYPLTITTYGTDGSELQTTYEKAPKKALAVYQGSVETMLALGLEDRLVGTAAWIMRCRMSRRLHFQRQTIWMSLRRPWRQ